MRRAVACFTLLASTAYAVNTGEVSLRGYTSEHAAAEVQWEQKFREIPDPAKVRENMRRMSARPPRVGRLMTRTTPSGCWRTQIVRAGREDRTV